MTRIYIIITFLLCSLTAKPQSESYKNMISLEGSISMSETTEIGGGYHYFPCKYFGFGGYIGSWALFPEDGVINETEEEKSERQNPFIKPTIIFKTPKLFAIKECDFSLAVEPGLMISTQQKMNLYSQNSGSHKQYHTDTHSWHCNFSLEVRYQIVVISAFYAISNLDVNRNYRDSKFLNGYTKEKVENIGLKLDFIF